MTRNKIGFIIDIDKNKNLKVRQKKRMKIKVRKKTTKYQKEALFFALQWISVENCGKRGAEKTEKMRRDEDEKQ